VGGLDYLKASHFSQDFGCIYLFFVTTLLEIPDDLLQAQVAPLQTQFIASASNQ
jgi:hypothetical protein